MSEPVVDPLVAPVVEPPPPPQITMADIMGAADVVKQREDVDKILLEGIQTISFETLRASLLRWAAAGFPNVYTVYEFPISTLGTCSDGVTRNLEDYIVFVSGKTIREHVDILQSRMTDIAVSFAYTGSSVIIVVSKV
jgi:hypothetical protein